MKSSICEVLLEVSKNKNGFVPFTNPAGSGKTFGTSHYIAQMMMTSKRKIFYVTPRLRNLNGLYEDLECALKECGHSELMDKVLLVKSYRDCVSAHPELIKVKGVTDEWKVAHDLYNNVSYLNDAKGVGSDVQAVIEQTFDGERSLERQFRRLLKKEFGKSYAKFCREHEDETIDRYDYMMNSKWNFISELYPSSTISKKQVMIVSSKKFLLRDDPIIDTAFMVSGKESIGNAIVLLDESDAIKNEMLSSILDSQDRMDVVDMFFIIHNAMQAIDGVTTQMVKKAKCEAVLNKIETGANALRERYFPEKWDVNLCELIDGEIIRCKDMSRIMNYQGIQAFFEGSKNYRYIPYQSEKEDVGIHAQCNKIMTKDDWSKLVGNESEEDIYFLSKFIKDITSFINSTFRKIYQIAVEYNKNEDEYYYFPSEFELTTVMNNMHIDKTNARRFLKYVKASGEYTKYFNVFKGREINNEIYCRGLYYNLVVTQDAFRDSDVVFNFALPYTPELMLLEMASQSLVIAISATSESIGISNYNLDFIKRGIKSLKQPKVKYIELTEDQIKCLSEEYKRNTKGYEEVETIVESVSVPSDLKDLSHVLALLWGEDKTHFDVKKNGGIQKDYFDVQSDLNMKLNEDCDSKRGRMIEYQYNRLVKVWFYIQKVLTLYKNDGIISNGIVVTQKLPEIEPGVNNLGVYTMENIKLGAIYIYQGLFGVSFDEAIDEVKKMFVRIAASDLNGEEISKKKARIFKERFLERKPVFMLTSYDSVSRGNNLQVKVGVKEVEHRMKYGELVCINDWRIKGELDWDSIYIDEPTNVLLNLGDEDNRNNEKQMLKALFAVEELYACNEITRNQKNEVLKDIFHTINGKYASLSNYFKLKKLPSVKADYSTAVYQTVGRIARTNVKKKMNAIFYDESLVTKMLLNEDEIGYTRVTHEFERLLKHLRNEEQLLNQALLEQCDPIEIDKCLRCEKAIEGILSEGNQSGWSKDLQTFWNELRLFVLKHPVVSRKELKAAKRYFEKEYKHLIHVFDFDLSDMYVVTKKGMNSYEYSILRNEQVEQNEFGFVVIDDDKNLKSYLKQVYKYEVSKQECRLEMLLKREDILEYWSNQELNCEWNTVDGEKVYGVINPVIYTNIYKGALGEEIIKFEFSKIGIELEEIRDPLEFEKFDFVFESKGKRIFVDAKNFGETSRHRDFANKELLDKVIKKKNAVKADLAIIINVIDEKEAYIPHEPWKGILAVPGIYSARYIKDCHLIMDGDELSRMQYVKQLIDRVLEEGDNKWILEE